MAKFLLPESSSSSLEVNDSNHQVTQTKESNVPRAASNSHDSQRDTEGRRSEFSFLNVVDFFFFWQVNDIFSTEIESPLQSILIYFETLNHRKITNLNNEKIFGRVLT